MAKVNAYNLTKKISKSANELLEDIMRSQEQVSGKIEKIKRIEIDLLKKQQAAEVDAASNAGIEDKSMNESETQVPKVEPKKGTDDIPVPKSADTSTQKNENVKSTEKNEQQVEQKKQPENAAKPVQPRQTYQNNNYNRDNNNNYNRNNNNQGGYNRTNNNQGGYGNNNNNYNRTNNNNNNGGYNRNNNQQNNNYNRTNNNQGGYSSNNNNNYNRTNNNNNNGGYNRNNNNQGGYNRTNNNQGGYGNNNNNYNRTNNNNNNGGYNRNNNNQGGYNRTNNNQGGYSSNNNNNYNRTNSGGYNNNRNNNQQGGYNKSNNYNKKPKAPVLAPPVEKERVSNYDPNKATYDKKRTHDKKSASRKLILNKNNTNFDEPRRYRGRRKKTIESKMVIEPIVIEKAIITGETITIKEFSEKIGKPASDIIKKLLLLGIMATINNEIDFDTASLIANEYGIELEQKIEQTYEEVMIGAYDTEKESENAITRSPVVTIMGHVDHGKTSLLDYIRRSSIVTQEAGGITQHIGAYTVNVDSKSITFLDTPGHEAFTSMRARGAQVTDIAVLVVSADDGVMPQTIEAINHAKAAEVPIIVAITKIDKPNTNIERIKQQLAEQELLPEEWGGETVVVPLSSKTGEGVPQLLEMISLVAEVQELTADPNIPAKGAIVEAELDKGRGPVATVLVQNGTLRTGDTIVAGVAYGRVRAMIDDKGNRVDSAGPSVPVEVLGFSEVPEAGDTLYVVSEDKLSKQVVEERKDKLKAEQLKSMTKVTLDDLFTHISEGNIKELAVVIKADVQGSAEALKQSLEKLSNENVKVRVIHSGVGAITKHDILLATASNGIIIGFNVRPDQSARMSQDYDNVDIRTYRVIYNAIEDVEKAMKGLLDPVFKEVVLGHAEVRQTFKVTGVGTIAGCYIQDGKATNNSSVRIVRDGIVIHEGEIETLKRFKDDAKEVTVGYECGIGIKNFNDVKDGDIYEFYNDEQVVDD